jgi:hypothetical protein
LIVAALWALDGGGRWRKLLLSAAPAACLMIAIVGEAPHVLFIVPTVALYGGASFLAASRWRDNTPRLLAILAMIALPLELGCFTYYYGINYTAFRFFPDRIEHPLGGRLALSTAFWISPIGKPVIGLGIAGAVWAAVTGPRKLRVFAAAHVVGSAIYFAIGIWLAFYAVDFRGSWPVYFETGIWPISLLFAVFVALAVFRSALLLGARLLRYRGERAAGGSGWALLALVVASVGAVNIAAGSSGDPCAGAGWDPSRPTPITELLQQQIGLEPGQPFRGLVATIDHIPQKGPADWISLHYQDQRVWAATGNDHRTVGLWQYQIPTLFRIHTFITPPYFLLLTEFLSRPGDRQLRSVIVLSRYDPDYLRLLGVRYLVTDRDVDFGRVVASLPIKDSETLRLIELADANRGDYSPTQVARVPDFRAGIAAMRAAGFDGRKVVVTDSALPGSLVPAGNMRLTYERYGLRLQAESARQSLLVLPAQFSHCWHAKGEGNPELFRADMMQLGVSFSSRLVRG